MRMVRLGGAAVIAALVTACSGGGAGGGVSPTAVNFGNAVSTTNQSVIVHQSVVRASVGAAPSVTARVYGFPAYSGGSSVTVATDYSFWLGVVQNANGQQGLLRVYGKTLKFAPFSPAQQYPQTGGTTLLASPNGRVWSIGVNDYYGTASAADALLGATVPEDSNTYQSGYTWGPGVTGPDGNLWYSVYGPIMGYSGCVGSCEPEELVKVNQNATGGTPTMYMPPQEPNGNGTEPNVVAVGPDKDIWLGGTAMPDVPGGTGFYRYSTDGKYLGAVPMKMSYLMIDAVAGPDGNMWVLGGDDVFRVTPTGVTTDYRIPTSDSSPAYITVGGDGALWFTEANSSKVGRITTSGSFAEYKIPTNGVVLNQIIGPSQGTAKNELWIGAGGYGRPASLIEVII